MTVEIPLTKGKYTIVDDCDSDLLFFKWRENMGYAVREIRPGGTKESRVAEFLHRVILERKIGRNLVKGEFCDHADRDRLNNIRANLRVATRSLNAANIMREIRTHKYKGVYLCKKPKKWRAIITVDGKRFHIGYFYDEAEAALAYNREAIRLFGEYARLNEVG